MSSRSSSRLLWQWQTLCAGVGVARGDGPDVTGISIDTRTLAAGDLFIALKGDPGPRFNVSQRSDRDGHDYLDQAVAAGAAGVLVERDPPVGTPSLVVNDTLDALWDLGRAARDRFEGRVVAVTGSSGKTTVKAFLSQTLDAFATPGSFNNHLGVPISLARTPADAASAVYEIGSNHPGEIAPLAQLARPDVAVVLNVHPAHVEFFDGIDALRREKLSIVKGLTHQGTLVCLDELDRSGVELPKNVLTFGRHADADVRLTSLDGDVATIASPSGRVEAVVPGGGEHRAISLAAAAAVLVALGENPQAITQIAADAVPAGRGNRIRVGNVTLIDDSYNANPVSMTAALLALAAERAGTVAVLGEMLELGDDSERLHAELSGACRGIGKILCVGEGMRALYERLPERQRHGFFSRPEDIDPQSVVATLAYGDVVLLKGSNRVFWARDFVIRLRASLSESAMRNRD